MGKRKVYLRSGRQRSVLTDMLPFEVPPTFSNIGFYRFLRRHGIEIVNRRVRWVSDNPDVEIALRILFSLTDQGAINEEIVSEWGKTFTRKSAPLKYESGLPKGTIPFQFKVAHKSDGRTLSVPHPRSQVEVAAFLADYYSLITYYAARSEFSLRRPVSVARYSFFKDDLHERRVEKDGHGVELDGREYEQLGSYFVYRKHRNIHKFFESKDYHRCEKKYDAMMQVDVAKCFDSIYTHSISWAILGKAQAKFNIDKSKGTFAGVFDQLMQGVNHGETNGILIGPEFSRIFAELILQNVDCDIQEALESLGLRHKRDYQIFRYVDDFFVFYNKTEDQQSILDAIQDSLRRKKMNLNASKMKPYLKPIITEVTIAKERISSLLNERIVPAAKVAEGADPSDPKRFDCEISPSKLIVHYKAILKEAGVEYGDLMNYTLAILESKTRKIISAYGECEKSDRDQRRVVRALHGLVEMCFFLYSASPKVNHTIRLCRIVSIAVDFIDRRAFPYEMKHLLYKFIYDNIIEQIEKYKMTPYREVESLYLLIALSQIGKEYWLPEESLLKHFVISKDAEGTYTRKGYLNHFSITVLLSYIRNKVRYNGLRAFIEQHIVAKLQATKAHCPLEAESLMLLLDTFTCPYVAVQAKESAGAVFGLDTVQTGKLVQLNSRWFTAWGDHFQIRRELDAKRSREVY